MDKKALLIVAYGAATPEAFAEAADPLIRATAARFPDREQRIALASPFLRKKLSDAGACYPLTEQALAELSEQGVSDLVVQPLFLTPGPHWQELAEQVGAVKSRFDSLRLGAVLLNAQPDLRRAADAILEMLPTEQSERAIVYMSHGSKGDISGGCILELERLLRETRGDIYIAAMEGKNDLQRVISELAEDETVGAAELRPLLLSISTHARRDLAGSSPQSWKSRLEAAGYAVTCTLIGLSQSEAIGKLFADHAESAALIR